MTAVQQLKFKKGDKLIAQRDFELFKKGTTITIQEVNNLKSLYLLGIYGTGTKTWVEDPTNFKQEITDWESEFK